MNQLSDRQSTGLSVAKNLVFGFVLLRAVSFIGAEDGVPLFTFLNEPFFSHIRWVIGAAIVAVWLSGKLRIALLCASAITIIFQFCLAYSSVGAFSFTPFFLFLFGLIYFRESENDHKNGALFFISAVFIFSAFQKINSNFLTGFEFSALGPFMSYLRLWLPSVPLPEAGPLTSAVAYLSIIFEAGVGFGILFLPSLFSQVTIFFLLLLSLLHPPVLYVYFFFLPLLVLTSDEVRRLYSKWLDRNHLLIPVAIAALLKLVAMDSTNLQRFPFLTYSITVSLLFIHAYSLRNFQRTTAVRPIFSRTALLIPMLMAFTVAGSYSILPSPLGFSMFSSTRFRIPRQTLEIQEPTACHLAVQKWRFSLVTDSAVELGQDGICRVHFPTADGLFTIAKEVCRSYPTTQFRHRGADFGCDHLQ